MLGFGVKSSAIMYTTAEIVVGFLLEQGMDASGIEGSSMLDDIRICAKAAASEQDYSVYGNAQLAVKFSDLEKQFSACGSLGSTLLEEQQAAEIAGLSLGGTGYSGENNVERASVPDFFDEVEHSAESVLGDLDSGGE